MSRVHFKCPATVVAAIAAAATLSACGHAVAAAGNAAPPSMSLEGGGPIGPPPHSGPFSLREAGPTDKVEQITLHAGTYYFSVRLDPTPPVCNWAVVIPGIPYASIIGRNPDMGGGHTLGQGDQMMIPRTTHYNLHIQSSCALTVKILWASASTMPIRTGAAYPNG